MWQTLVAFGPSVLVGVQTLLVGGGLRGDDRQKPFGQLLGGLVVALASAAFMHPERDVRDFAIATVSGAFVAWGVRDQIVLMRVLGVSRAMPLSMGAQLVAVSFGGVLLLGEWSVLAALAFGAAAVCSLIIGMWFVSRTESDGDATTSIDEKPDWGRGLRLLATSTIGLAGYLLLVQFFGISGEEALLPQAIGWTITIVVLTAPCLSKGLGQTDRRFTKSTIPFIGVGVLWGAAILLVQVASTLIGVATAFTLSQLGVVISTLGGIFWLHEGRTRKEMQWTFIGLGLVVLGAVLVGFAKAVGS